MPPFSLTLWTHWHWVQHICASELGHHSSGNGLSPARHQTITSTNADISSTGSLRTNFRETWIKIQKLAFNKMHLKMSSAKFCPFHFGSIVLKMHQFDLRNGIIYNPYIIVHTEKHSWDQKEINYHFKTYLSNASSTLNTFLNTKINQPLSFTDR